MTAAPLSGTKVVACASGAAAGYALRLLATLGAEAVLVEPEGGSALRRAPPFLPDSETSALFAYLTAGSRVQTGGLEAALATADILLHDTPLGEREALGLTEEAFAHMAPRRFGRARISISSMPQAKAICCPTGFLSSNFQDGHRSNLMAISPNIRAGWPRRSAR
jgi:CoA-transferase family III